MSDDQGCHKCGQQGHWAKECPTNEGGGGNDDGRQKQKPYKATGAFEAKYAGGGDRGGGRDAGRGGRDGGRGRGRGGGDEGGRGRGGRGEGRGGRGRGHGGEYEEGGHGRGGNGEGRGGRGRGRGRGGEDEGGRGIGGGKDSIGMKALAEPKFTLNKGTDAEHAWMTLNPEEREWVRQMIRNKNGGNGYDADSFLSKDCRKITDDLFDELDTDNSGELHANDFNCGLDSSQRKKNLNLWANIVKAFDFNGDTAVSREEFLAMFLLQTLKADFHEPVVNVKDAAADVPLVGLLGRPKKIGAGVGVGKKSLLQQQLYWRPSWKVQFENKFKEVAKQYMSDKAIHLSRTLSGGV